MFLCGVFFSNFLCFFLGLISVFFFFFTIIQQVPLCCSRTASFHPKSRLLNIIILLTVLYCLPKMPIVACFGGASSPSVRLDVLAREEERRATELLKAEQFRKELGKKPALRQQVQEEAQRKLEARRDSAFKHMEDMELHRVFSGGSTHKRFWAWRKQAVLELQQLRETERLGMAQGTDTLIPPMENVTWDHTDTGESRLCITFKDPTDITNILPITTPAQFALQQQHTPDHSPCSRSGSLGLPPGKRISFCDMPQIRCDPEHYCWLRQSVSLRLVKGSSRGKSRLWTQLASLMWSTTY